MPTKVNDVSKAVAKMRPAQDRIDCLLDGTDAMRAAGKKYLPRFEMESQKKYDVRLKTSVLFNGMGRTLENMAAKPFAEAITCTDIEPVAKEWLADIDLCKNNLTVFAHNVFTAGMSYGLTHILVEVPPTMDDDGKPLYLTKAQELAANVRPYLVHIKPKQILGWRSGKDKTGAEVPMMVRIMESIEEPDGEFGTVSVAQVRVLTPGAWATYRKSEDAKRDDWVVHKSGKTSLNFIPMVTYYTRRDGFMTAKPPLDDLAHLNVLHWQLSSDRYSLLHTASVPIFATIGLNDEDAIKIGSGSVLNLPAGADAKYVEHSGAAIGAGREALQDLENQMRAMGAELLVETQVAITATQNNTEDDEATCQLKRMVQGLEDALDNAVGIMHTWMKLEYKGSLDVFDDFASDTLMATAGPFVLALIQLVNNGLISKEDAFNEMQRYGILNPDLVWADVQAKMELEPPMFAVPMPGAPAPAPTPAPKPAPAPAPDDQ